jgi:hypothetical protein
MTKVIFTFPVRRVASLSCIWMKTGNPAQPLVCKWTSSALSSADLLATGADEPEDCRRCA